MATLIIKMIKVYRNWREHPKYTFGQKYVLQDSNYQRILMNGDLKENPTGTTYYYNDKSFRK